MSTRKPQRPRLERNAKSKFSAALFKAAGNEAQIELDGGGSEYIYLTLATAKRLHAFLTKAIAYIEAQKSKRGRV